MRINESCDILGITASTFYECYVNKGKIRKTGIRGNNYSYIFNKEDIQDILNDRQEALDGHQIVLIDPKTMSIQKTYKTRNEVIDDLVVTINALNSCLCHATNTCENYILKYKKDATEDNIKLYSNKQKYALDGTIKCTHCKEWVETKNSFRGLCKMCYNKQKTKYNNTYNGFFNTMASHIKQRQKIRSEKCTIDAHFLKNLYEEQKGLCFYSNLKMNTTVKSDFQASPERINNLIGYTKSNVKLICLEFNVGYNQWSKENINLLKIQREQPIDVDELKVKIEEAKIVNRKLNNDRSERKVEIVNDVEYYECTKCHDFKTKPEFCSDKDNRYNICVICKECTKIKYNNYSNSFRGFLICKLRDARSSAKKRNDNKNRIGTHGEFKLTIDDLFDKLLEQQGRCYYSQMALSFTPNSKWRMSIERLDPNKGYVSDNIALICVEFNSTDTTASRKYTGTSGSAQWSKEKITLLLDALNKQKPTPTNYREWKETMLASTLATHDKELFSMKFSQNKRIPTNYQEWKEMMLASTLAMHDKELLSMKFSQNKQKLVPNNYQKWREILNVSTIQTHNRELLLIKF